MILPAALLALVGLAMALTTCVAGFIDFVARKSLAKKIAAARHEGKPCPRCTCSGCRRGVSALGGGLE